MSKFDKVFEAREDSVKENIDSTAEKNTTDKVRVGKQTKRKTSKSAEAKIGEVSEDITGKKPNNTKQRGRPKAKRSDPAFIGFTTYIRKDTHLKVKIALLQEGKGREMSELVEDLLSGWVKNK